MTKTRASQINWGAAGVVATVVFGLVAFAGYTMKDLVNSHQNPPPAAATASGNPVAPTSTAPGASATAGPATNTSSATPASSPSMPAPPALVTSISVDVDDVPVLPKGRRVGPGVWQLVPEADKPTVHVSVAWMSKSSDGVIVDARSCQMIVRIAGPQDIPAARSANCKSGHLSAFEQNNFKFEVNNPGTYTVTVLDEVSGVRGKADFTVIR